MSDKLRLQDVFDKNDHAQLSDLITRVAERIFLLSRAPKTPIDINLCNPAAIFMLQQYLQILLEQVDKAVDLGSRYGEITASIEINMDKRNLN